MTDQHKHAAVLRAIADGQDAEWRGSDMSPWIPIGNGITNPIGSPELQWRVKTRVIMINGVEVPEPYRGPLKARENYFFPGFVDKSFSLEDLMAAGFLHLTSDAADRHEAAILSFTRIGGGV